LLHNIEVECKVKAQVVSCGQKLNLFVAEGNSYLW